MNLAVTDADLLAAATTSRRAIETTIDEDWSVPAGDLDWDVRATIGHVSDALVWCAAHLAARSRRRLRVDFRPHDHCSNGELLDILDAAAATLASVARAAAPEARAYHPDGHADVAGFLAMGCDELLVHTWDVGAGLGWGLLVEPALADRVVRRLFPWAPTDAAPWPALLWANGRVELPGRPRLGPDWSWHCAPRAVWDGTIPTRRPCHPLGGA
jgi:hypothetical protein